MSIDKALQQLFAMAHKELVWENASPNSSFAAQTLTLDLSGSRFVIVETKASNSNDFRHIKVIRIGTTTYLDTLINVAANSTVYARTRSCTVNADGVEFGSAYNRQITSTGTTQNDAFAIPIRIYTIKK